MSSLGCGKKLNNYEDVDEDEILATLTNEELQELEREMAAINPDENTPTGLRQQDQTAKKPTGSFCREALLRHWQNETHKLLKTDNSNIGPSQESMDESQTDKSEEECLSESDTGPSQETMRRPGNSKEVNSYSQTVINVSQTGYKNSGSKCSGTNRFLLRQTDSNLSAMSERPNRNSIDIDGILEKILRNDESVSEVNLNNIENISQGMLITFAEALSANTHVQTFSLANTHADDQVAFALANTIKKNYCITSLNIESNFITGRGILAVVSSLQQNNSLVELRFHNQRHICGSQVEMEMVNLLKENTTLLKLGYQFDLPGPRMSATNILTRNQDRQRQTRMLFQRQNQKSEETMEQTPHTRRNGPSLTVPIIPVNRLLTSSQGQKHNFDPRSKTLIPHVQIEKNGPNRKTGEMVKLQRQIAAEKLHQNIQDTNKERKSGDLFKDVNHALKATPRKKQEDRNSQQSVHGDLMAAICSSRMATLNKVNDLHDEYS